jgi:FkbM family methyltransferase
MKSEQKVTDGPRLTLSPSTIWSRTLVAAVRLGGTTHAVGNGLGLVAAGKVVGKVAPKNVECLVKLNSDTDFVFELDDFYWNRLVARKYVYEADMVSILKRIQHIPYTFIDGGANYGYWSVLVSSKEMGRHPAIAVEALGSTYAKLVRNCQQNPDHQIESIHAAISDTVGDTVQITTWGKHAGSSLDSAWLTDRSGEARVEDVTTVTVDSIATRLPDATPMVVKLDVEGSEVAAFKGSVEALERGAVLLYEDFGQDTECRPSRHLLEMAHIAIFAVGPLGSIKRMHTVQDVQAIKTYAKTGYNLAATRVGSAFYREFSPR